MNECHRQRKAGDLQTFLAHLETKVRVLEVSDEIFLVEAADRLIDLAPQKRARPCDGLALDEFSSWRRARETRSRMLVQIHPQGGIPLESHPIVLDGAVRMMQAGAEHPDFGIRNEDRPHLSKPAGRDRNDIRVEKEHEWRARVCHSKIGCACVAPILAAPNRSERHAEAYFEHGSLGGESRNEAVIVDYIDELSRGDEVR